MAAISRHVFVVPAFPLAFALAMAPHPAPGQVSAPYTAVIGGSDRDLVHGIARDPIGNIYIVGETYSPDFPIVGGVQSQRRGAQDAFVVKLNPAGTQVIYSTLLGGTSFDAAYAVVADDVGNAYVTGYTNSADFPLVGALKAKCGGFSDAFITKIDPQGNQILFSTYLGGNSEEIAQGIALDALGNVYVVGRTRSDASLALNAAQPIFGGAEDALIAKLNASLTSYAYVTYFGGSQPEIGFAIDVSASGRVCVVGRTESANLPVTNAPQASTGSGGDAFFAVLDPTGAAFTVASYLGGSGSDTALGVSCTDTRLAIVGDTQSLDFPTYPTNSASVQTAAGGDTDGFLATYSLASVVPARELVTYVGGTRTDRLVGVTISGSGRISAAGETASSGLPEVGGAVRGLAGAGAFRGNADGTNWQRSGLQGIGINDLAFAASTPQRWLAATDQGLAISTDDGQTWVRQVVGLPARVIHTVAVHPTDACTWVIGVDSAAADPTPVGAARTTDCGVTWSPWGVPALRFLTVDWLGDPTRLVVQVSKTSSQAISRCVVDQDGAEVRCLGSEVTTSVIAVDTSNSCLFYAGTAFGTVQRVTQGGSGCNHPFSNQDTGAALGAPVTAMTVVPDPLGSRVLAGTANGKVVQSIPSVTPAWTPLPNPVPIPYRVNAMTSTPSGAEAVVLFTTADGRTLVTHYNASTLTPPVELEGATSVSTLLAEGNTLGGVARGFRDVYGLTLGSTLDLASAAYSGTECDDEVSAVFLDLVERLARTGVTKGCQAQNQIGPGGQEDVAVGLDTSSEPPCTTSVALEVSTLDASGLDGSIVNFSNTGICDATPVSNAGWITVGKFTAAPGTSGWVDLQFERNTGPARTGTVAIGNQLLIVTQDAAPAPDQLQVRHADTSFTGDGGVGRASLSGISWGGISVAAEDSDWLRIVRGSGTTDITYVVDENFGPNPRSQTITFRTNVGALLTTIVVTQAGATPRCASPTTTTVSSPADGGPVSVVIEAPPGCQHTSRETSASVGALAFAPNSTPGSPGVVSGTGAGTLSFVVSANVGPGRTMAIDAAGHGVTIVQAAADAAVAQRASLAEGATSQFFDTEIALVNPSPDTAVVATATFDTAQGQSFDESVLLLPLGRGTLTPKNVPGLEQAEFATSLAADGPFTVARVMTWDVTAYGSHAEGGIAAPATRWYLAEGATHSGFDLFYLLQNPGSTPATVDVRYLRPAPLAPVTRTYTVAPHSRFNIWVNQEGPELASTDVSAVITATNGVPVTVERAMYLSNQGRQFNAGHESAGIAAPATEWFLAEGNTGAYFDLFILIANPTALDAPIAVRYLLGDGSVIEKSGLVPANSRSNIWVDQEDPRLADAAVSTTITSTAGVPLVVERAMWWPGASPTWHEAHNSAGATQTGTRWAVAAGEVGGPNAVETYVLIANTSAFAGQARVTLMFEGGLAPESRTYDLLPTSRTNVPVGLDFPAAAGRKFGVLVESLGTTPAHLVVEEATYSNSGGVTWAAGANLLATRLP